MASLETLNDATRQAAVIRRFWARQDKTVSTWVETQKLDVLAPDGTPHKTIVHVVRSDMVNGLPPATRLRHAA